MISAVNSQHFQILSDTQLLISITFRSYSTNHKFCRRHVQLLGDMSVTIDSLRELLIKVVAAVTENILPALFAKIDDIARFTIDEMPKVEALLLEILEIMFSPRQLMRQLVIVTAVQLRSPSYCCHTRSQ